MELMFLKKVPLSDEDKKQLQKELLHYGMQEEQHEAELEAYRDSAKTQIKAKEYEIMNAKVKRREIQSILANEYRMLQVQCKRFIDQELQKELIIQIQTLELLEAKDANPYIDYTLEFDDLNVATLDEHTIKQLITAEPEVFTQTPSKVVNEDNDYFNTKNYLVFGYNMDIRLAKLNGTLSYDSLLDIINKEAINHSIDM